jgi:hypothetical protein
MENLPLNQLRSLEAQAALVGRKHVSSHRSAGYARLRDNCLSPRAKTHQTVKVIQPLSDTALYEVKADGTVLIDWNEVEAFAASKTNPILCHRRK